MGMRIGVVMAVLWCAFLGQAKGDDLKGKVLCPDGSPASKAEVRLVRYDSARGRHVSDVTQTDEKGEFLFPGVGSVWVGRHPWNAVVAYRPGLALGWTDAESWDPENPVIQLGQPSPWKGKVCDTKGQPVRVAKVLPDFIGIQRSPEDWDYLTVPEELGLRWGTETNDGGEFALTVFPAGVNGEVIVQAPGFARHEVDLRQRKADETIVLYKASVLQGQVRCPDPQVKLSGIEVTYSGQIRDSRGTAKGRGRTVTDEQGRFTFNVAMPGEVTVSVEAEPSLEWQPKAAQKFRLAEGQNKDPIVFELVKGIKVSGRVVEAETGKPIPGASVHTDSGPLGIGHEVIPDDEGRYSFYATPGRWSLMVWFQGETSVTTPGVRARSRRIQVSSEPVTVPDFRLGRSWLEGVVVEENGKPAPYALLKSPYLGFPSTPVKCDAAGRFRWYGLSPNDPVTLLARKANAFSTAVTVAPKDQKEPLRMVVKEGGAARLKGRVTDDQGQPVGHAQVNIFLFQSGTGTQMAKLQTDEKGLLQSDSLWPGVAYTLQVSADKHLPNPGLKWNAEPGKVHDVGDIVLASKKETGFLAGHVLDSTGNPVAGARVWNAGDASKLVETTTDAKGAFRLDALREGYAYAFAEKHGFRLAGLRARTGTENLVVQLYRKDEKQPAVPLRPPAELNRAELRDLVVKLVDLGFRQSEREKDERRKDAIRGALVQHLARVDSTRAKELSLQHGGRYDREIAMGLAQEVRDKAPGEFVAYLNAVPEPDRKARLLVSATTRAAKRDPEKAKTWLEHALPAIRAIPNVPERTLLLAKLSGLMMELGILGGRELLDECVAKARAFGGTDREAYARGVVAEQVCEFDLDAAMGILKPIAGADERERHLVNIACRIADKHPDQAEDLLAQVQGHGQQLAPGLPDASRILARMQAETRDNAIARVCRRLAKADLPRAEKLAGRIQETPKAKGQALAWMAEQIAEKDRSKAFQLLDQAVSVQTEIPKGQTSFEYLPGPAVRVAVVARTAAQMGHPEAREMLWRALSVRPRILDHGPDMRQADARLAIALSTLDAAIARDFLEPLMPHLSDSRVPPGYPQFVEHAMTEAANDLALAALILDPKLCEEFLDRLFKAQKPFDVERLVEYLVSDAADRKTLVNNALGVPRPDEDN